MAEEEKEITEGTEEPITEEAPIEEDAEGFFVSEDEEDVEEKENRQNTFNRRHTHDGLDSEFIKVLHKGFVLAIGKGGTGASTAATARTSLDAQQTLSGLSLTAATVALTDKVLIQDTDDSDNLKTATVQSIIDLVDIDTEQIVKSMTAGESLSSGNVVCIKPSTEDFSPSDDAYADQNQPTTVFNTVRLRCKGDSGGASDATRSFIKFDETAFPLAEYILKAELILTKRIGTSKSNRPLRRVSSADWDETTLTWNNQPSTTTDLTTIYAVPNSFDDPASGTVTIDITQIVRHWKDGNVTNYGLSLEPVGTTEMDYESDETDNDASKKPILRITKLSTSDGKVYKANADSFEKSRTLVGVAQATIATDAAGDIALSGSVVSAITGVSGISAGRAYLGLSDGGGAVGDNVLDRRIPIAKVMDSNSFLLDMPHKDILIEDTIADVAQIDIAASATNRYYIPVDTQYVLVYIGNEDATHSKSILKVMRDTIGITSLLFIDNDGTSGGNPQVTVAFGGNYIDITEGTGGGSVVTIFNILCYT